MPRKYTRKNRRNRHKRGGQEPDIEMGPISEYEYMGQIPPDPERFKKYEKKTMELALARPGTPDEVISVFEGPTPEEKQKLEQKNMADEDPLNKDPFEREELTIFGDKGGRRTRKKRRNKKRKNTRRRRH